MYKNNNHYYAYPSKNCFFCFIAQTMLEDLYQQEIIEKSQEKKNTRLQVAQLLEKMYQEQKARVTRSAVSSNIAKSNENEKNNCNNLKESTILIHRVTKIGLAFLQSWVEYHENFEFDLEKNVCQIMKQANSWGKLTKTVAQTIENHLEFLLDIDIDCL